MVQEQEIPTRTRMLRRRGKARKLKYTWKSAGYPYIRKRIADGKQQSCKQYTSCGCQQMCGKLCPCMHNGTCCEKYCGYVFTSPDYDLQLFVSVSFYSEQHIERKTTDINSRNMFVFEYVKECLLWGKFSIFIS